MCPTVMLDRLVIRRIEVRVIFRRASRPKFTAASYSTLTPTMRTAMVLVDIRTLLVGA